MTCLMSKAYSGFEVRVPDLQKVSTELLVPLHHIPAGVEHYCSDHSSYEVGALV